MKKIRALLLHICIVLSGLALATTGFTFAWLSGATTFVNVEDAGGSVISEYFHPNIGSNGSAEHPYVITKPVHLYNLTQLYENLDGFAGENNHFQLGYDLDNDGDLEFYKYTDDGKIVANDFSDSLNMKSFPGFIPIGSEDHPFGGTFDGSNLTIDNLSISGEGVSDIGVFGYVTENAEVKDLYINNLDIDVTGAVANAHDIHDTNAYVGYIAGHIDDAKSFENTYVNNCKISGHSVLTRNDWGYFGKCKNAASLGVFIQKAIDGEGEDNVWGGTFNSKEYVNWLYDLCATGNYDSWVKASTNNGRLVKNVSGDGGYKVDYTVICSTSGSSSIPTGFSNPSTSQVTYRFRDGAFIPLKFTDSNKTQTDLGNSGYLVGSNVGTGVNASPKVASYNMVNIGNAISNTEYTNMYNTYRAPNIAFDDSKLEILTYQDGWKRIEDDHNVENTTTNGQITGYTKTSLEDLGFKKYKKSRNKLQEILTDTSMIDGIHFDNNAISTSSLLTVPANTIRINDKKVTTTYQLPKGSINFNLKEEGYINFYAGTFNSSDVNLNFFSLYQVTRNANGNITALTQIKKIYAATSGEGYIYQTGNSKPSGAGTLLFDVEAILHANAPVKNMMYYFEIPANAGEYAMGVAGSTQGAYMIYLDLAANGGIEPEPTEVDDFASVEYRSSPNTAESSILLITYTQQAAQAFNISVVYIESEKRYNITYSGIVSDLYITQLNTDYKIYVNGPMLPQEIKMNTIFSSS